MNEMFDKIKKLVGENEEKVDAGVDKATDFIDQKTGGKSAGVTEKVDKAVDDATDKMRSGDAGAAPPPPPPTTPAAPPA